MVPLTSLLLPILLSAVLVFVASSIIHMVLGYHRNDYGPLPNEEAARTALRGTAPGDYMIPWGGSPAAMKDPAFQEKLRTGPNAVIHVASSFNMGRSLAMWFVYCLVASLFAAYIASRALAPGANYLEVFRFAGATAFIGYSLALWQNPIWGGKRASATLKSTFDGLIYALLTAGTFGWLWPS